MRHWRQACDHLAVQDIPSIIKTCRAPGPLYLSSLSEAELKLLDNMMNRLYNIAEIAAKVNTFALLTSWSCLVL